MTPTVCIVTDDSGLADRYVAALGSANCRHTPRWLPASIDDAVDVVLFDPAIVARSTVAAERMIRDRPYRVVAIGADIETTVRQVERAMDKRRFEATIDARFDALSVSAVDLPAVAVPGSLSVADFGEFYETV